VKAASLSDGLPHIHAEQLGSNEPGTTTGCIPLDLHIGDPPIVALDAKDRLAEVAGKLANPWVFKRDLRVRNVATTLGERAKWLGKNGGHSQRHHAGAQVADASIRQPGGVIDRCDESPSATALNDGGHKTSHSRALTQRQDEVNVRDVRREKS
jgi:hypothetical protein